MRRVALVTGGTRGIGVGIARALAARNVDLALCGVRPESDVASVLTGLRDEGARVCYFQADVSDTGARGRLLAGIREAFGALHVLVNNAGVAPLERRDLLDATEESFERVMRINLQGPYFLTQAAARWMVEQKGADPAFSGCIVNVSSISATVASVNRGEYCISKAGVAMATSLWAARLAEFDIGVYEVRPGIIGTDMTAGVRGKYDAMIAQGVFPQARWGTSEDVGKAVAMLARGDLAYSTGQVICVDGGFSLRRL
jgi:3-oxoacyl-[acyl-carrier protein] reductase